MQVHLDVEDGREAGRRFAHVSELGRLVDGERVGASKFDEEQIVLNEVVTKRRFGERTVCQTVREGMLGVGPPLGGCICLQTLEETHDLSPGSLLNEWLCLATNSTSQTGWALTLPASITRAGIWREVLEFARLPLPLLRVGRGRFFDRNIWPDFRVFRIQRQPFLKPRLGVSFDRVVWAFRLADSAIDAFVRVDDEHVLALVEAVHGAHVDAVHAFAANTALVDDEGQLSALSADRSDELIHGVSPSSRCSFVG